MQIARIKKKSGGFRTIYKQGPMDKHKYRALNVVLQKKLLELYPEDRAVSFGSTDRPRVCRGFMPGENPVTNAMVHAGKKFVLSMDLKDFFDHCTVELIIKGLKTPMASSGETEDRELARSCCISEAGKPPEKAKRRDQLAARQGLSSSPAACNISVVPMVREILGAIPDNMSFTVYADDYTFSSDSIEDLKAIRDEMPEIAKRHGQVVNKKKTRIQSLVFGNVVITGVGLDKEGNVRPTRAVRRKLRVAEHRAKLKPHWYNNSIRNGLKEWASCKLPRRQDEQTEEATNHLRDGRA